jgi:hypothetical protein
MYRTCSDMSVHWSSVYFTRINVLLTFMVIERKDDLKLWIDIFFPIWLYLHVAENMWLWWIWINFLVCNLHWTIFIIGLCIYFETKRKFMNIYWCTIVNCLLRNPFCWIIQEPNINYLIKEAKFCFLILAFQNAQTLVSYHNQRNTA